MTYRQQITIHTSGHGDMHDLTEQVRAAVATSGIQTGTVNVFNGADRGGAAHVESSSPGCSTICRTSWTN